MMPAELYSIGEVAEAFDVPVSTLRYYDDIGLVRAPVRRSRVRYYDRESLARLAYVLLWRLDGMLSVEHTAAIVASSNSQQRNALLRRSCEQLSDRITRLINARDTLEHMMDCPDDDPVHCIVTGVQLRNQVDDALARVNR